MTAAPGLNIAPYVPVFDGRAFVDAVSRVAPIFTAEPSSRPGEFRRPARWTDLHIDGNGERLASWRPGNALMAVLGDWLAVVDVDTKAGADVDTTRTWLHHLRVVVVADVLTPSGGRHFYIKGDPDLPTVHASAGREGLHGLPGVEVLSHGTNVFLPGTVRPKYNGTGYVVLDDQLAGVSEGTDGGTSALVAWINAHRPLRHEAIAPTPPWAGRVQNNRETAYLDAVLRNAYDRLVATTAGGRNVALFKEAMGCGNLIAGAGLDETEVMQVLTAAAEANGLTADDGAHSVQSTLRSGLSIGTSRPRAVPAETRVDDRALVPIVAGSIPETDTHTHAPKTSTSTIEAHVSADVAHTVLSGHICWTEGLGWLRYDRGAWRRSSDVEAVEIVRVYLVDRLATEMRSGADSERLKRLAGLMTSAKVAGITRLARGIVHVDLSDFDTHPDLLCVGNGVVDLRTGDLVPHDPALLLTRTTPVDYYPDATSPDWTAALEAVPSRVSEWLQVRIGQAASGRPTPDDLLPVLQGSGSNGKTTITGSVLRALGEHAVVIPERVLLANPSDHPTELMTLRGARFALIEETPEGKELSVKRLKDTVGTPTMTARAIRKDNVTWDATHSLFLTTNYVPKVNETDHGTWRRLALVHFPYTFVDGPAGAVRADQRTGRPGLRERLRDGREGQREAVLAWIVEGARRSYADGRPLAAPPEVLEATKAWRRDADLLFGFVSERLEFDPQARVLSTDLYAEFCCYAAERGHPAWTDQTFASRFFDHQLVLGAGLQKRRTTSAAGLAQRSARSTLPTGTMTVVTGLRFLAGEPVRD